MPQRRAVARGSSAGTDKEETVPFSQALGPVTPVEGKQLTLDGGDEDEAMSPLSIEDRFEAERKNARIKHWKESPFAVGCVGMTWEEECSRDRACCDQQCCDTDVDANCCICCSGMFCGKLGAVRVGNMAVLKQSMEWVEHVEVDEESGEEKTRRFQRPKIDCVVGPYWPMLMCVTYPLILGVSLWTAIVAIPDKGIFLQLFWGTCTFGLIYSLAMTACTDPGVLYRHHQPPPQEENSWRWSDQGQTYRPRGSYYDSDCAVVVEDFDHTCPWTGTAIGKRNMIYFQCFVGLVFLCLIFDIVLLTGAL